jgi:Cof subfamily protein (haloacid dehalogenase superfamily)
MSPRTSSRRPAAANPPSPIRLPAAFPVGVQAFACDFDRTLVGRDALLRPRTRAAITRSQAAGIPVLVATGRMFRSVRPYLEEAGIADPVVCYQGAAVVDTRSGEFLLHEPIPLDVARGAIRLLDELGHSPNCYVADRLYVARHTEYSRMYSEFQHIPVEEVGDLVAWIEEPPTKLVAVADPEQIPALRQALVSAFDGRLFLTTSLPYLLELGNPAVSKGTGVAYVADRIGLSLDRIVSFGDGENDIELIADAGFGIAVEDANPLLLERADWTCPSADEEGVATVIDAYLDSLA